VTWGGGPAPPGGTARTAGEARPAAACAGSRRRPLPAPRRPPRPARASPPSAPSRADRRSARPCGRRGSGGAFAPPLRRSRPTPRPRPAQARAADGSRGPLGAQGADAERAGSGVVVRVGFVFLRGDRALGEQVLAQLLVEVRVAAAQPFERHGRVLLLVVTVVLEHGAGGVVTAGDRPLVVPVDRLQFLHDRDDRPMAIDRLRAPDLRRPLPDV